VIDSYLFLLGTARFLSIFDARENSYSYDKLRLPAGRGNLRPRLRRSSGPAMDFGNMRSLGARFLLASGDCGPTRSSRRAGAPGCCDCSGAALEAALLRVRGEAARGRGRIGVSMGPQARRADSDPLRRAWIAGLDGYLRALGAGGPSMRALVLATVGILKPPAFRLLTRT
jgi:hypothetical protein